MGWGPRRGKGMPPVWLVVHFWGAGMVEFLDISVLFVNGTQIDAILISLVVW
jgi:hypothetical protein